MTIKLIAVGKTDKKELRTLSEDYLKRLKRYVKVEFVIIPDLKNRKVLSEIQQKEHEAQLIMKQIETSDFVILLDERGKQRSSVGFAKYLQKKMNSGTKRLVFVIGGPYGFSNELYDFSNECMALSEMTFSHQMVRLFFIEQLYRALSILRGEPYHHQ